jgi:hypothetical protein
MQNNHQSLQDDGCGKAAERRKAIRGESSLFK